VTVSAPVGRRLSRRQRVAYRRLLLYLILIVGIGAMAFLADWTKVQRAFFNVDLARTMWPGVLTIGAKNTVLYTSLAFGFGLVLALFLALMKISSVPPYRWLATGYIELFRGLPALVTILLVTFAIPIGFGTQLGMSSIQRATLGLGLVAGAYMAETIRAGLQAVPRGQMEAARSLGMSHTTAMTFIVIPQAFCIIITPLTNELVLLIKDTSLLFLAGTTPLTVELTQFGRDAMSKTFNGTPLTVIAIAYLVITLPMTRVVAQLEKRAGRGR